VRIVHETPITARSTEGRSGQWPGSGDDLAIEKSEKNGSVLSRGNSNHYGIAAYYSMMALPHDLIGISLTNSDCYVVRLSGGMCYWERNPISVTAPALKERPFVLDMSRPWPPWGK